MLNQAILLALVCGVAALLYGGFTAMWILRQPDGSWRMDHFFGFEDSTRPPPSPR